MSKRFELSVLIHAPLEQVFDTLADPILAAKAAGALEVQELSQVPVTAGATWKVEGSLLLWGSVSYLITIYEKPQRLAKRIAGSIVATVEDIFELVSGGW